MWVFARSIPTTYTILAPRAIIETPEGGFGWASPEAGFPTPFHALTPAVERLLAQIQIWAETYKTNAFPIEWMGFSQGAAMVYAITALRPDVVNKAACLAGYLPGGAEDRLCLSDLAGKQFFIAHGSQDETVAPTYGRAAAQCLQQSGAKVDYCETETGHKLGAACFKGLDGFFGDGL